MPVKSKIALEEVIVIFYLVVFAIATLFAFLSDRFSSGRTEWTINWGIIRNDLASVLCFCVSALVLVIVRGLRYGIGIDYFYTYVTKFAQALNSEPMWGDPFYNSFIEICASVSTDYLLMFIVDAVIFISLIYLAIWFSGCSKWKSVALFCLSYHYLRSFIFQAQYFAMSLCLVGCVLAFCKRRRAVGVIAIAVATGFHSSAIVLLPIYILCCILNARKGDFDKYVLMLSAGVPLMALAARQFIPGVLSTLLAGTRYSAYFGDAFSGDPFSWYLFGVNAALLLFFMVVFLGVRKTAVAKVIGMSAVLQSYALALTLLTGVIPLMYRLVFYAMLFQVITIPIALGGLKAVISRRVVTAGILLAFAAVQFVYLQPDDTDAVFQYVSVFNPEKLPKRLDRYERDALLKYETALIEKGAASA